MYLSFYRLKHKPFQISTDPRFLWLGEKHEEALATLRYGVLDNKGFLLLTGDVGTGKTTLINALLQTLGHDTLVATVRDPDLEPMDFYNYTAHAFGMPKNFTSKGAFLIAFERFLLDADTANKTVLLIIDEAQRISQTVLEEVRLLSNIEKKDKKLLNIFFVGQIEFNEILLRPENRAIRQRITVNYNIQPLTRQETEEYIQHRLRIAGSGEMLFEREALNKIFSFSRGYPRLINIICDRSLLTGFVAEVQPISAAQVQECIEELTIPRPVTLEPAPQQSPPDHPAAGNAQSPQGQKPAPLLPAIKQKDAEPAREQRILVLLLGFLFAAAALTFVFSDDIRHQARHLIDFSFNNSGKEPAKLPARSAAPDTAMPDTRPQNNPKTAGSPPAPNNSQAGVPETKEQNTSAAGTAAEGNEAAAYGTAPKDDPKPVDASSGSDGIGVAVQKADEISLDEFTTLIIPFSSDFNFTAADAADDLDKLAQILRQNPEYTVIVKGYTDSNGNDNYNRKLSEFRAVAVKSYLIGKGIAESRVIAQGFGSQNPIASNETPSSRLANRRVEIELRK